ncbi:MAG: hypothetical protein K8L99_18220 [Anaerolineae bacterium]|nr:hypothetical protein [Anaerolineae bacterium]
MAAGFRWAGSIDGSEPIIRRFVVADTVVLSRGEIVNLESGEVDAGAAGDSAFLGPATEDVDNTDDGLSVSVITNPGAIYAVDDANVRVAGATLDLASGGLGVTGTSNADFKVWADSAADEPTLVVFNGNHAFGWA